MIQLPPHAFNHIKWIKQGHVICDIDVDDRVSINICVVVKTWLPSSYRRSFAEQCICIYMQFFHILHITCPSTHRYSRFKRFVKCQFIWKNLWGFRRNCNNFILPCFRQILTIRLAFHSFLWTFFVGHWIIGEKISIISQQWWLAYVRIYIFKNRSEICSTSDKSMCRMPSGAPIMIFMEKLIFLYLNGVH